MCSRTRSFTFRAATVSTCRMLLQAAHTDTDFRIFTTFRSCLSSQQLCSEEGVFSGHAQRDLQAVFGSALAVSAGGVHTCALRTDGQLVCFGYNEDGRCDVPSDLGPVLAVSASSFFDTCALRTDGQFVCFGNINERDVPADFARV